MKLAKTHLDLDPIRHLPSILVLYSRKDIEYKQEVERYFASFKSENLFQKVTFRSIEDQPGTWWLKTGEYWDIFVPLLSIHLVTNSSHDMILNRLKGEQTAKRAQIAPIVLGECLTHLDKYQNTSILPANQKARENRIYWNGMDDFYCAVFAEIVPVLKKAFEYKSAHESSWAIARQQNSVEAYDHFIQDYQYSQYLAEAKERRDQVEESGLWAAAEESGALIDYFNYVIHTPLNLHRDEAIAKIAQFEFMEEAAWEDVEEFKQASDFFEYRANYPMGKHRQEVEKLIEKKLLKEQFELQENFPEQGIRNNLRYLAYARMSPHEIYSMESCLTYLDKLIRRSSYNTQELSNYKYVPRYIIITLLLVIPLSSGIIAQTNRFALFVMLVFATWTAMEFVIKWKYFLADIQYVNDAIKDLKYFQVLLLIAFSTHNESLIQKILRHTYTIQKNLASIRQKGMLDYMKQEEAIIFSDPKKTLPPVRRNN